MNTIGLSAGHVNALTFGHEMLDMPKLDEMLEAFVQVKGIDNPLAVIPQMVVEREDNETILLPA